MLFNSARSRSREDANDLTDEHRAFIFDLDIHEMSNEDDDNMEQYSVDSFRHGEYTLKSLFGH